MTHDSDIKKFQLQTINAIAVQEPTNQQVGNPIRFLSLGVHDASLNPSSSFLPPINIVTGAHLRPDAPSRAWCCGGGVRSVRAGRS